MTYSCPSCVFGTMKPTRITYLRRWGPYLVTVPNFPAWQCDSCSYTRYDVAALARLEVLLGPDDEALVDFGLSRPRSGEGPGERGPQRWSF
ncbi:MAG: YgiT-type zinc finger protein [Anaerolineae bacterium]